MRETYCLVQSEHQVLKTSLPCQHFRESCEDPWSFTPQSLRFFKQYELTAFRKLSSLLYRCRLLVCREKAT